MHVHGFHNITLWVYICMYKTSYMHVHRQCKMYIHIHMYVCVHAGHGQFMLRTYQLNTVHIVFFTVLCVFLYVSVHLLQTAHVISLVFSYGGQGRAPQRGSTW